jgi:hypothetical protein
MTNLEKLGFTTLIVRAIKAENENGHGLMSDDETNKRLLKAFDAVNKELLTDERLIRHVKDGATFLEKAFGLDNYHEIRDAEQGRYL